MINVHVFTFNPFSENSYVLSDETGECVIIDPGCFGRDEQQELKSFIEEQQLKPVRLLNTHCHIDHVFGNDFVSRTWNLGLEMNEKDMPVLQSFGQVCRMYGVAPVESQPEPARFLNEGDELAFGKSKLAVFLTPGHSPGSVSFYSAADKILISGDVLFQRSIGRTDLPGGNFETLISSIREKIFVLPGDTVVYSGHGPSTTVAEEKQENPFLKQ
ncbi:MAG: beta-lactamase domain-containing protein [Bacteroidetes bacterium]|nr:MAG: beta-lactamase domain-containing protein [Bacteroidota bacterium]